MTLRLLIYTHSWFPSIGGVQTVTMSLARGIAEWEESHPDRGVEVTLVTKMPSSGMDDSTLAFRVVRQPSFLQLFRLIREADVIHIAGPCLLPLSIAWLLRKPTVVEHHGYQAICPNGLLFKQPSQTLCPGHFAQGQYRECMRCCSSTMGFAGGFGTLLLVFPRRWLCQKVAANIMVTNHAGMRLNLPRSLTIYHGIPEPHPSSLGDASSASNGLEIAYVGRLVAEKGLPVLLNAAKHLKEQGIAFRLTFIGGGPEQGRLQQLVESLGLVDLVNFTGDLRGPALDQAVSKVAAVVMPSVWEETAGLSAIEQMMRGRVVIAADVGGLSEVVDDAGLRFSPGESDALATCIQKVIGNPSLVASLGSAARARAVRLFNRESMIQAHISLYWGAVHH